MARRRGGQTAAVSGPGKLSRRTDKAAPAVSTAGGADYGERKALAQQEAVAPTGPTAGAGGAPSPGGGGGPGLGGPTAGGVFGSTERPGEPATFGAATGGQVAATNVEHALRVMYAKFPHPAIARLMRKAPERRAYQQ